MVGGTPATRVHAGASPTDGTFSDVLIWEKRRFRARASLPPEPSRARARAKMSLLLFGLRKGRISPRLWVCPRDYGLFSGIIPKKPIFRTDDISVKNSRSGCLIHWVLGAHSSSRGALAFWSVPPSPLNAPEWGISVQKGEVNHQGGPESCQPTGQRKRRPVKA